MKRASSVFLLTGLVGVLITACKQATPPRSCLPNNEPAIWRVSMRDSIAEYEVHGTIEIGRAGGTTQLAATSRDGMTEPLTYPINDVRIEGDTLSFGFAPIGYRVVVQCVDSLTAVGTFVRPQPPFDSLRGFVRLMRERAAP